MWNPAHPGAEGRHQPDPVTQARVVNQTDEPADCAADGGGQALFKGSTTASYFWDDASGINGDTGAPASGEPMQKGLAASPSWPMGTKGYVMYEGKKADFFIGDRGPGTPSNEGIMLDLDGKTFAELTGGNWNSTSLTVEGVGGAGHIPVEYVVTEWGPGPGKKGAPEPFSTGAYGITDNSDTSTICPTPAAKAASAVADAVAVPMSLEAPKAASAKVASAKVATASAATTAAVATHGFSRVSATSPQVEQGVPVPAVSTAVVVCALAVAGAKIVFRRPAGRHHGR